MNVNFEAINYGDKAIPINGKVMVHSTRRVPSMTDTGYIIQPGYSYHFYIRKS